MKTYEIKDLLKKGLLLIELPENGNTFDELTFLDSETKGYTLLGKPDEIMEDDAAQLIPMYFDYEKTAVEYLAEMIESEIYWENPLGDKPILFEYTKGKSCINEPKEWERIKSEQKTFDKNKSLIFVKI